MHKINEALTVPILANMVERGRTQMLPNDEPRKIGYSIVIYPAASIFLMTKSMQQLMSHQKQNGSTTGMI